MKKILVVMVVSLAAASAQARVEEDLINCIRMNGTSMDAETCRLYRKADPRVYKRQLWEASPEGQAVKKAEEDRIAREKAERAAKAEEERKKNLAAAQEWKRRDDAEQAKIRRNWKETEEKYESAMRKQEKACGRDYQNPRIGMSYERAEQCLGVLSFHGEILAERGPTDVYKSQWYIVHFRGGKLVAAARRKY